MDIMRSEILVGIFSTLRVPQYEVRALMVSLSCRFSVLIVCEPRVLSNCFLRRMELH